MSPTPVTVKYLATTMCDTFRDGRGWSGLGGDRERGAVQVLRTMLGLAWQGAPRDSVMLLPPHPTCLLLLPCCCPRCGSTRWRRPRCTCWQRCSPGGEGR